MLRFPSKDATAPEKQQENDDEGARALETKKHEDERARVLAKRRDQGNHECEVLGQGCEAAEASRTWNSCEKNPGHERFIPVSAFCIDDLPERYRKQSFFDLVKGFSDLVVRLRVNYTSAKRPKGYPFHGSGGQNIAHTGSGLLSHVDTYEGDCECPDDSTDNDGPHRKWFVVSVVTACHVVFDSEEASKTMVDFFYNDEVSRKDGRMKTVWAYCVTKRYVYGDLCIVDCVTCDLSLIDQLHHILLSKLPQWGLFNSRDKFKVQKRSLCIVISHSHGKSKQITVGNMESYTFKAHQRPELNFKYRTDTCHGSSGGLVIRFDCEFPVLILRAAIHVTGHGEINESSTVVIETFDLHDARRELHQMKSEGNYMSMARNIVKKSHCENPLFRVSASSFPFLKKD
ncbi:hypothetical protein PoB_006812400 [Plakobranchus ocellatus]|uniref:Uncharacterized protein n=1 Tax=Plakobranchus ocellatus TaxID=259542 RepID=A0AAV4DBN2_9GAST|nr:hypothetical protein PoB_006812400 [Plakobranchus ocellatus]